MHWLRGEDVESLCTDMNKSRNNKHYDFIDLIMHFKDGYISPDARAHRTFKYADFFSRASIGTWCN
jgi:hypothetical protein